MVAFTTQPPLPTLSPEDKHLLRRYFALNQSVEALAADLATSPLGTGDSALSTSPDEYTLAAWTLSDPIAPHIAYRRAESQRARQERSLEALDAVLKSESPLERRRAATTILRMIARSNSPTAKERAGGRESPQLPPSPAAGGRGARAAGGEGSVSTPPTDSPTTSRAHPNQALTHSPHLPIPQSPHPSLPEPTIINAVIEAILNPNDQTAQATVQNLLSPDATLDDKPAAATQLAALHPKTRITSHSRDRHIHLTPGPPESRTSISYIYSQGPRQLTLRITLTRSPSGPHPSCWLISRIDVNKDQDPQFRKNSS